MLFGLIGSSGVGKTTLATKISENLGIEYVSASITQSARRHGFNSVGVLTLRERLDLQWHLLRDHVELINQTARPLIVDRTPVDMIGYLMAEFDMHSHMLTEPEDLIEADRYVTECLAVTLKHYDMVFTLGQLDKYEEVPTRPVDNRAYQTHSQLIMEGALSRLYGQINFARIGSTDLQQRLDAVEGMIVARMDEIETERKSSPFMH